MKSEQTTSLLETVDVALYVLEFLAASGESQPLSRISRSLSISKPRLHRILATLVNRGYVTRDPITSFYGFGSMCASITLQSQSRRTLPSTCFSALEWLWQETGETAYLAVLEAGFAVVIEKLDSLHSVIATSRLGRFVPLHSVSAGKVLLAAQPDHHVDTLITQSLSSFSEALPSDRSVILGEVQRTRTSGYAENIGGFRERVAGVAAPVYWAPHGSVAAAIAVCVPIDRFTTAKKRLRANVCSAGKIASEALESLVYNQDDVQRTSRVIEGKFRSRQIDSAKQARHDTKVTAI